MQVIKRASPNRHPVRLVMYEGGVYCVQTTDPEGCWDEDCCPEFERRDEAEAAFEATVRELAERPNWEAQAEYDEQHGTDCGYAPWDLRREY